MNESQVVLAKLDNLQRCIHRIERKLPFNLKQLQTDWDIQDVVSLNLQRAVQSCVDICSIILSRSDDNTPNGMAECFVFLYQSGVLTQNVSNRMRKAVGLRNILVHEYVSIDWKIIHQVVTKHLNDFRQFASEVLKWNER